MHIKNKTSQIIKIFVHEKKKIIIATGADNIMLMLLCDPANVVKDIFERLSRKQDIHLSQIVCLWINLIYPDIH